MISGSIVCGTSGLVVGDVGAGGDEQVASRAAPVDRDHRVERAVGDRHRIAVQLRDIDLEPFDIAG